MVISPVDTASAPASVWLRKKRLAAGFATDADLARAIGARPQQLRHWGRGDGKPTWVYITPLAAALGVTPEETVAELWGERIDDPCGCGCGGRKVPPAGTQARKLAIRLPCTRCGRVRVHQGDGRRSHRPLCLACKNTLQLTAPRITFTCVGYDDHDVRRHAKGCAGTRSLTAAEVREWKEKQARRQAAGREIWGKGRHRPKRWQQSFLDEGSKEYRCLSCATGSLVIAVTEKRMGGMTDGERIRSGKQRREILKAAAEEEEPQPQKRNPFRPPQISRSRRKSEHLSDAGRLAIAQGHIVSRWSKPALPHIAISHCAGCGKLIFRPKSEADRPGDRHLVCFSEWLGSPEGRRFASRRARGLTTDPMPRPRGHPGRPTTAENLRRDFAWAIQHHLGSQSFRQIAGREKLTHQTVQEAVSRIIADLPDPKLARRDFRHHVEMLLAASSN